MTKRKPKAVPAASPTAKGSAVGRSLGEFKASYDKAFILPKRIKEALVKLRSEWLYETEFAKLAGVAPTELALYRAQFDAHIVQLRAKDGNKRVWAGTAKAAAELRGMI